MLTTPLLALTFSLIPSLATAAIFPQGTTVKMLDAKSFKKAMKANETSMVAFVAPWCGHCQRMAPEYSRAAEALTPLIPVYAVDCDDEKNKRLCAEQGVQGFPTVKLFPRGSQIPPMTYDAAERTASAFFYWASRRVPSVVKKLYNVDELEPWIEKSASSPKPRALLLTKAKKLPLLWKVLANKYSDNLDFASHRNRKGKGSKALGYEEIEDSSIVLIYSPGETRAVRYRGEAKLESLSKYFDTIVDGTADLSVPEEPASTSE
ncbi:disulfide isomerase, partial [Armillaria fumosa]